VRIESGDTQPSAGQPVTAAAALPGQPATVASPLENLPSLLRTARLQPGSPLFVAWEVVLAPGSPAAPAAAAARAIAGAGATPWLSLEFRTPAPLPANSARLQEELQAAAEVAAAAPESAYFQVVWRPEGGTGQSFDAADYAFLLKRAAVAIAGARPQARVSTDALPANPEALGAFYAQEVSAYLEVVALRPAEQPELAAAIQSMQKLDPGRPLALDSLPYPADPGGTLAEAARRAAQGVDLTLFRSAEVDAARLSPLALLAREFAGDLSYDPSGAPGGAAEAWTFVRGKDLALRVIAVSPAAPGGVAPGDLVLRFADPSLRRPTRFPFSAGRSAPPAGRLVEGGLEIRLPNPGPVEVLGLERATAAERRGVAERVNVASQHEMEVEEILKRLQAFEDGQSRRLDNYQALNTTHLRFQPSAGAEGLEATLEGPFFWSRESGADWAWETLYINGVRWRNKTLPEIPLIQPEKAAALPLEIHFTEEYRYRLRGTDRVDGRDAWVVDFSPTVPASAGLKLYQGSVWIDRQVDARLRTRAVQVGLQGEVISNEETLIYTPVDAGGNPAPWSRESFVLPLRLLAQQTLSILNQATVVDRETVLTSVRINGPDFAAQKKKIEDSEVTMVRDTDKGLRYLVKDKAGERVVKEKFATSKLFAAGGLFYDHALSYPLPLAGANYFSLDYKKTGKQLNLFFAGVLLTGAMAEPHFMGSDFDLGGEIFGIAFPFTDNLFRNGKEAHPEEIKALPASVAVAFGHPIGNFVKLGFEYTLLHASYSRSTNTERDFVLPADNFLHAFELDLRFARSGYRLTATGSYNHRSRWDFWGLPGNHDFDPKQQSFVHYDVSAGKNWYLPHFQKVGAELDYLSGSNLDRFSKYQFGFFGGARVHGFRSNSVRATEAYAGHFTYGFEVGELFRLDGVLDAALATDKESGLRNRRLAGAGLVGTTMGPWQTIVNLDLGVPVAGPDHGFTLYLVFLKLFK
jgi:hypothetical protein